MKSTITLVACMGMLFLSISLQAQEETRRSSNEAYERIMAMDMPVKGESAAARSPQTTFFEEGFESGNFTAKGWVLNDADGDGFQWIVSGNYTPHTGSYTAGSASWTSTQGALNPDNWMASPAIDLTSASGTVLLDFWVRAQDQVWPKDHIGVYASTSGNTPADFKGANGALLYEETVSANNDFANNLYAKRTLDLSAYAGAPVYIAFRHFDCTDWFVVDIDDIIVYESSTVDLGITAVNAPSNEDKCMLEGEEPVTVTIFNFGGAPQTGFEVSYTLNGETVTEVFEETVLPASSKQFTFMQKAAFPELGYYNMDFSVQIEGDIDESNNDFSYSISNTDARVTIQVNTDSQGGQAWELISSTGEVIALHGGYQWNITETTEVCVIADDCYRFNWYGGGSNTVSVFYNGDLVNTTVANGSYTLYSVGSACQPVNVFYGGHNVENYGVTGETMFGGYLQNTGVENLNSFDVQYSVNGMMSTLSTISGIDVPQGQYYEFTHPEVYDFTEIGAYEVEISVGNFNGSFTPELNTLGNTINILSYRPVTRVMGEEGTGTWCGWCTRGHVFMEYMEQKYPDTWIGVAVHNNDPMVVSNYDNGMGNFISGYPSGLVNRHDFGDGFDVDPSQFEEAYNILINKVVPADITISATNYNEANRKLQFHVNAIFAGDIERDFNISAVLVEHEVTGTGTSWNQANYYSGGGNGPMGGYEDLPDPVPASQMVYQNVARAMLGGWPGHSGVINNPTTSGSSYSYAFSYTLPSDEEIDNFVLIGVVTDAQTGEIMNANKVDFATAVHTDQSIELPELGIYPNPVNEVLHIDLRNHSGEDMRIFITDHLGRMVSIVKEQVKTTHFTDKMDVSGLAPGIYYLNVSTAKGMTVSKLIKS